MNPQAVLQERSEASTELANAIVDNTLAKVTKAGNFGYLSVAPNFGDNCFMEDIMSVNWEASRLDRDANAIELAKAEGASMLTPEGRQRAQAIKDQLKEWESILKAMQQVKIDCKVIRAKLLGGRR